MIENEHLRAECERLRLLSESADSHTKDGNIPDFPGNILRHFIDAASELAKVSAVDALCRRAVELARTHLGFERCGLFLRSNPDPNVFQGTYGTDSRGETRDEHHLQYDLRQEPLLAEVVQSRQTVPHVTRDLYCCDWDGVQKIADHAAQLLWEGANIVGIMFVDTLLTCRPLTQTHLDLLALYASTLGVLCAQKRTEEALERSERIYREAIENASGVPYRLIYEGWKYDFVGKGLEQLLGVKPEDLSLQTFNSVVKKAHFHDPKARKDYYAYVDDFLQGRLDHFRTDLQVLTPQGEFKWIYDCSVPIKDPATGKVIGSLGILQDVTERKKAELAVAEYAIELARSNEELEHFAYVASHDLREPLRKISSFSELLARRYKNQLDDEANTIISYVTDGAERMHRLIDDLLLYSRVGRAEFAMQHTPLDDILKTTLLDLEKTILDSSAQIFAERLPTLPVNPGSIGQLFQNLISNAIKFRSEQQPEIHISSIESYDEWTITVRDNGIGFEPRYAERVFKVFQRLHPAGKYPGTGMGLAICKKIVERHHGRIWVESEKGAGATFHFTLPKHSS